VATYPPVTDAERDQAIARIARRHAEIDDTRWSEAHAESDTAAREVLSYLRRRHLSLPHAVAAADVWDELVLNAWLYWEERRRERDLLRRARRYGLSLRELGAFLGIGTAQGMTDYLDRLDALLTEHARHTRHPTRDDPDHAAPPTGDTTPPDLRRAPHIATSFVGRSRDVRGADVHTAREHRAGQQPRPARDTWLEHHAPRIASVIADLLTQAARIGLRPNADDFHDAGDSTTVSSPAEPPPGSAPRERNSPEEQTENTDLPDYLSWLAAYLESPDPDGAQVRFTPATISSLGLVLGELRTHPAAAALPRNHGLHTAMSAADRLRADYANLRPA
jgi:hypothetical protein